ncbi:MAG: Rv3235 family protein [Propionibacteriaceae bacterium]|jgi:hypothetical protein|nr:Rv3235 family protein [Propionibacteriaceae bacterium]
MANSLPHCALGASSFEPPAWRWRDHWRGAVALIAQPPLPAPPEAGVTPDAAPSSEESVQALAQHWATLILEALNGHRSVAQLDEWFDLGQRRALVRAARDCRAAGGARLAGLVAQAPDDGLAEVALALVIPPRVRAVAFSLVCYRGVWRCSALTLG